MYVRDVIGSVTRPLRELKAFRRISLAEGESTELTFEIRSEDLAFYTKRGEWEAEPGEFEIFVGSNSADTLSTSFTMR